MMRPGVLFPFLKLMHFLMNRRPLNFRGSDKPNAIRPDLLVPIATVPPLAETPVPLTPALQTLLPLLAPRWQILLQLPNEHALLPELQPRSAMAKSVERLTLPREIAFKLAPLQAVEMPPPIV